MKTFVFNVLRLCGVKLKLSDVGVTDYYAPASDSLCKSEEEEEERQHQSQILYSSYIRNTSSPQLQTGH